MVSFESWEREGKEKDTADCMQAQTPQQRKANDKFKKAQDAKRGKPASEIKKKEEFKSPISPIWLGMSSKSFCCEGWSQIYNKEQNGAES